MNADSMEPIELSATLDTIRSPGLRLPTIDDLQALLPDAHVEQVGDRQELVVYTGWTVAEDGETLVPMDPKND